MHISDKVMSEYLSIRYECEQANVPLHRDFFDPNIFTEEEIIYFLKNSEPTELPEAFNLRMQYPYSKIYKYAAWLDRIDLEHEREKDISTNNGFRIRNPQSIKKDIKDDWSIFSSKFGGGSATDINPSADKYRCKCGLTNGRINNGTICPSCGTTVKYMDGNFNYFGWIVLDNYKVIHPNLYYSLRSLIGGDRLDRIIKPIDEKDQDGHSIERVVTKDEPFKGIGMIEFRERFDEIIEFYVNKHPAKRPFYDDILKNRSIVFTDSIPVFTTLLRPCKINDGYLYFEGTNSLYNIMARLASSINDNSTVITRKAKPKNKFLYDFQEKLNKLYKSLEAIISGKKGSIRGLFGGRYNFTARCVIIPDPSLEIDQIALPYECLMEILQQVIVNILQKTYSMSYFEAYTKWYMGNLQRDPILVGVIESIIRNYPHGIPFIINRNPTISYGGEMQMYCVKLTNSYSMGIPLQILTPLAADFDGDVLNILWIINKAFLEQCEKVFNPRNSMFISRNNGMMNNEVNHNRDTLININTMVRLARESYTPDELSAINKLKQM